MVILLDCRRDNLRLADACENAFNTALVSNNTSGYKGVYFHKASADFMPALGRMGCVYSLDIMMI